MGVPPLTSSCSSDSSRGHLLQAPCPDSPYPPPLSDHSTKYEMADEQPMKYVLNPGRKYGTRQNPIVIPDSDDEE